MKNIKITNAIYTQLPTDTEGNEDWSKSTDGGNYAFGYRNIVQNGEVVIKLYATSASFDFCECTGCFTRTECIGIEGTELYVNAGKGLIPNKEVSLKELKEYIF